MSKLPAFMSSGDIEVQERASSAFILVEMLYDELKGLKANVAEDLLSGLNEIIEEKSNVGISSNAIDIVQEMALLFTGDLNPVAPKAQRKVPIPPGLNLDEWINAPPSESESSSSDEDQTSLFVSNEPEYKENKKKKSIEISEEEMTKLRERRKLEQSNNPNYLKGSSNTKPTSNGDVDDIPIAELALEIPLQIHSSKRSDKYLYEEQKKSKKSSKSGSVKKKSMKSKLKTYVESSESEEGNFFIIKRIKFRLSL